MSLHSYIFTLILSLLLVMSASVAVDAHTRIKKGSIETETDENTRAFINVLLVFGIVSVLASIGMIVLNIKKN